MPEHVHLLTTEPERETVSAGTTGNEAVSIAAVDRHSPTLLAVTLLRFQCVDGEEAGHIENFLRMVRLG
jgi:hypothetical protein